MEKTNGYYVAKYLKNNALVLLCELVVVLLLSLICTIIMEADPLWLAPVIAVVTYLVAEVRFMMAYVATNARHEHDMAVAKGELAEDEQENEQEPAEEEPTPVADAALFVAVAAAAAEQDEEPAEQDEAEEQEPATDEADEAEDTEETDEVFNEDDAAEDEQEESVESETDDDFSREVRLQLDKFLNAPKEAHVEQLDEQIDEQIEQDDAEQDSDEQDDAEPVFDELPPRVSLEIDDEDEAMDALFGSPVFEQDDEKEPEIVLDSLEIADDELDGMTMDGDDFARDVLEIGEIEAAADDEQ
jgi:hypothetical protein